MPGFERPGDTMSAETRQDFRWLMSSDVCKHCTHAGCLDVCPTGALFRTEFATVVVQQDICNGCGYCVSGCPYGVIERREGDGRAWKCTLCYDRLRDGLEPACAKACPTDSIQFGVLDELRERAALRWTEELTLLSERDVPDELYEATRAVFSEDEVVQLTLCVITINAWNRFNVAFRSTVGVHVARVPQAATAPGSSETEAHVPGTPAAVSG